MYDGPFPKPNQVVHLTKLQLISAMFLSRLYFESVIGHCIFIIANSKEGECALKHDTRWIGRSTTLWRDIRLANQSKAPWIPAMTLMRCKFKEESLPQTAEIPEALSNSVEQTYWSVGSWRELKLSKHLRPFKNE